MSKNHRFPLVLILHVQKWLLFAHVNLNSFSSFYSARSVPLPYTSCTMTLSDGIPYRYDGLSYRKTEITEVLFHNGCTVSGFPPHDFTWPAFGRAVPPAICKGMLAALGEGGAIRAGDCLVNVHTICLFL